MSKKEITKTLIISGTILVIALILVFAFKSPSSKNTINVEGTATIDAMPNLIGIYFNVQTSGDTTAEANEANAEIVEDLKSSLDILGIKEDEIKTQNYNIYQDYDWVNGERVEKGYVASHSIKIELDTGNLSKIGLVVDAGADAGAAINYINFELSSELQNSYKAEAMQLAAQDARMKAEAIAVGLNKKVGRLVSVSTSDFGYSPWNLYTAKGLGVAEDAEEARTATTSIAPSEQEISSRVSVVFKLR